MTSLSTGQLANLFNIPKPTIRHYVDEQLLVPIINDRNSYQQFSERDVYRLYQIIFLRKIGFSIEEIKKMLKEDTILTELKASVVDLENQIQELKAVQKTVNTILKVEEGIEMGEIQFVEQTSRYLKEVPESLIKRDSIDFVEAEKQGFSQLELLITIINRDGMECSYLMSEKLDSNKELISGTYACKNVELIEPEQLEKEIELFMKDPILQISSDQEIVVYENIYSSLGYSEKEVWTLEARI
ncbi:MULTISPECIES: MerR family transcriptional regulator [Vagococcus]|uniref:HTH merR-type domain-containing protein n=1 Tax=Vagococcus fluvialis bH819 TaxID=1255619 RepID=A0A1X6WKY2_9ENTE|nr:MULTISPECIES: MerR family transcriptional regulator [Vagococcus]SLM84991.1 hypothetical protein FM121_02770 [Vagococcus fluvialis bH819]HCM88592.1 hypothetical protein [Vagococcus sp.]